MTRKKSSSREVHLPSAEEIQNELAQVESIDDFFGKEGVFGKLFARTIEEMLEAELSAHLGYEKYEASGRNSGNSRNGKRESSLQTSVGKQRIRVPRDRNGEFQSPLLEQLAIYLRQLRLHHALPLEYLRPYVTIQEHA